MPSNHLHEPHELLHCTRWCSFWHVNGVAVFREETDANGTGGAMMVSTIVRAAPKAVYKVKLSICC